MKKLLAVVMAVVLLLSMSVTALASEVWNISSVSSELCRYNDETERMSSFGVGSSPVPSGETLYIQLGTQVDGDKGLEFENITKLEDMKHYKIVLRTLAGEGLVESARFAIRRDPTGFKSTYIGVTLGENKTGKDATADFKITVKPKDGATMLNADIDLDFEYSVVVAPAKAPAKPASSSTAPVTPAPSSSIAPPAPSSSVAAPVSSKEEASTSSSAAEVIAPVESSSAIASSEEQAIVQPEPQPEPEEEKSEPRNLWMIIIIAALAVVVIALIVILILRRRREN